MDDDTLLAYLLDHLPPAETAAVEAHLAGHPADAAKVARARRALRPLEADRDGIDPPPGLAVAAVARTAEYLVANRLFPDPTPEPPVEPARSGVARLRSEPEWGLPGWRRADVVVACGIAFLLAGLGLAGIGKLREESRVRACQANLGELYVALAGYSDTHDGRFPQVGTDAVPTAGAFADELVRSGQYPAGQAAVCPAAESPPRVGYAYTLGYLGPNGQLVGLRKSDGPDGAGDWTPITADLPARRRAGAAAVPAHARGQNVLFVGGAVRFATTPAVGVNGDHIYHNDAGLPRAGLHRDDSCLGRPPDMP
jgi:hypothetical protein